MPEPLGQRIAQRILQLGALLLLAAVALFVVDNMDGATTPTNRPGVSIDPVQSDRLAELADQEEAVDNCRVLPDDCALVP